MTTMKCRDCGRFMNCEDSDAVVDFTPDSDYSVETISWICGPCVRMAGRSGVGV